MKSPGGQSPCLKKKREERERISYYINGKKGI